MAVNNDTQYAYAVARIRAIERKLLDKSKIDRMVDARSPEEALKVLTDAEYGYSAGEISSVYEYEQLLREEHKKVYKLLKEIAPQPEVFDLFLVRNDYHNAKVILKAEFLGQDFDELLTDTGSIPATKLKIMIKDRNMSDMPVIMQKAIEECIDTFNRTGDPQVIDLILDKASFRQMKETAERSKVKFVIDLVEILIDLANIKTFLRVKRLKKSWDFLNKILIPGGRIDLKVFVQKLEEPLEGFVEALRYTPYGVFCEEGIENFKSTGNLTNFEKLSDDFVISFIKKAKYVSLGIEPLVGYLMAKENEIKIARIIMVGKINNISNEIIRERLREAYV
ncbi:MAG: V/A-type H+/Na+-transporting ATPase subunit [Petroclostridium sp.]|uniref:V-type ATP synthase subunit C n=1 Tax=Petroclostridium xylanilyticum TaxID=1792311 RepID=UPI000B9986F5|nr:V-type ATP synthase subunit C [Petroclostridium xylanilyticum]MBZ4645053.1 archaeal/vacuolar-type H+-ATPase subunit [Clostridia bacterium]MDK2811744.1 V/A-type H+/Na+-transporting ATPase subunit [Petroclostridium sp.]